MFSHNNAQQSRDEIFSDKFGSLLMLTLPALVAKWQTRTLEVRVEKSMGVRVSPSALYLISEIYLTSRLVDWGPAL